MQLEQNVEGTLTLNWTPSPDEKRDDRLHYMVMQRDSVKRTWWTVADHLFNHRFTTVIVQGREYYFRVYAKNDMGLSEPSESPTWGAVKKKGLDIHDFLKDISHPVFYLYNMDDIIKPVLLVISRVLTTNHKMSNHSQTNHYNK